MEKRRSRTIIKYVDRLRFNERKNSSFLWSLYKLSVNNISVIKLNKIWKVRHIIDDTKTQTSINIIIAVSVK